MKKILTLLTSTIIMSSAGLAVLSHESNIQSNRTVQTAKIDLTIDISDYALPETEQTYKFDTKDVINNPHYTWIDTNNDGEYDKAQYIDEIPAENIGKSSIQDYLIDNSRVFKLRYTEYPEIGIFIDSLLGVTASAENSNFWAVEYSDGTQTPSGVQDLIIQENNEYVFALTSFTL